MDYFINKGLIIFAIVSCWFNSVRDSENNQFLREWNQKSHTCAHEIIHGSCFKNCSLEDRLKDLISIDFGFFFLVCEHTCNSGVFKISLSPEVTVNKVLLSEGSSGAAAELHLLHPRGRWVSYAVIHGVCRTGSWTRWSLWSWCLPTQLILWSWDAVITDWCIMEEERQGQSFFFFFLRAQSAHDVYVGNEVQATCWL